MQMFRTTISRRRLMQCLAFALPAYLGARDARAGDDQPPVAIAFDFDRPLDGSMTPFFVAASRGLYAAEHLSVIFSNASGSPDAIARIARGEADLALVDINELIRAHDKSNGTAGKAIFVLFNTAPYAIVARKSRGIRTLADIEGKTVGVADTDLSIHLWPALARRNGINAAHVKFYQISTAVREPILSAGQVDAVTGFSYLSAVNLRDRGVPADDLSVLRYADYGCEAYGHSVIVNPAFAASRPEAVRGFVRALIGAINITMKEPARAVDEVVGRIDNAVRELELERLNSVLADNILTPEVRQNGLGGVDPARLERSIDQVAEDHKFKKRPGAADIFDDSFLPPVGGRLIN